MVAEGAGITLCEQSILVHLLHSVQVLVVLPSLSDRSTKPRRRIFIFLLLLEDSEIGGFEQVGVMGGFEMLENLLLYEYDLLRGLSLQ